MDIEKDDLDIEKDDCIKLRCLEIIQPIGKFYVAVIDFKNLIRISWADVRRIAGEKRDVETYLGIERPLSSKRVVELKQYVTTIDATFPSSIILALDSRDTKYNKEAGVIYLRNTENVAKVLDGQHRIAGLEGYTCANFELIVTIFVDMDIEDQAMVFATINLEQTKVNKSLAYDLFDYAKHRSPQKTSHHIVRLLDSKEGSPFKDKIKILGTAGNPEETVSQALFIDSLLPLISKNPKQDRDLLKKEQPLVRATPDQEQLMIFRNMFIDKRDSDIAKVLWNYFLTVEDKWGDYWRSVKPGYVLNRTTGFRGLMLFLPYTYRKLVKPGQVPSREQFKGIFDLISLRGEDITPENYRPGSSGPTELRNHLCAQASLA